MAPANVLITGGSGYIGGTLLWHLTQHKEPSIPTSSTLYSLVRSEDQANQTKTVYGIEPLALDLSSEEDISLALEKHSIHIVVFLIDSRSSNVALRFIKALEKLQRRTGVQTHFVYASGAKGFSSHVDFPLEPPVSDEDERMYAIQKGQESCTKKGRVIPTANNAIIEAAEAHGVRAYVVVPCIVYGEGEGFGKKVSIQTVAVVKAARAKRKMYSVTPGRAIWPVCHIRDQASMLACLLKNILTGAKVGHNRNGYFLASPGSVAWDDIYAAMGAALLRHGIVDDDKVIEADQEALQLMAKALECTPDTVSLEMGGTCTWIPKHAKSIGWVPTYKPKHILEAANAEVDLILQ